MRAKKWIPKVGEEVWFFYHLTIDKGKIVSIGGILGNTFEVEFDLAGSRARYYLFSVFKTKKAAKAALIEKLEHALEEAKRL